MKAIMRSIQILFLNIFFKDLFKKNTILKFYNKTKTIVILLGLCLMFSSCTLKKRSTELTKPELDVLLEMSNEFSKFSNTIVNENGQRVLKIPDEKLKLMQEALAKKSPGNKKVHKYFFYDLDHKGNIVAPKTFMCGWAAEQVAGWGFNTGEKGIKKGQHCNVQFDPLDVNNGGDYLIGRMVNASEPNWENWAPYIRIKINKHFYVEKRKDGNGRELNELVENSSRSNWSARPFMELDLESLEVMNRSWGNYKKVNLGNVEWDYVNRFLGFDYSVTKPIYVSWWWMSWLVDHATVKYRFNFLNFDHDKTFEETPYHLDNAKHINVLHIMGESEFSSHLGEQQFYKAVKWDTRKTTDLYAHNCSTSEQEIAKDVVELWNDAFEALGHGRLFNFKISKRKNAFDMRYSTINCIQDYRLSKNSLGIGMITADRRNGKILWGGVTIWTGKINQIINSVSPVPSISAASSYQANTPENSFGFNYSLLDPKIYSSKNISKSNLIRNNLAYEFNFDGFKQMATETITNLAHTNTNSENNIELNPALQYILSSNDGIISSEDRDTFLDLLMNNFSQENNSSKKYLTQSLSDIENYFKQINMDAQLDDQSFNNLSLNDLFNNNLSGQASNSGFNLNLPSEFTQFGMSIGQYGKLTRDESYISFEGNSDVLDLELTAETVSTSIAHGKALLKNKLGEIGNNFELKDYLELANLEDNLVKTYIKDLLLHEVGHMIGLGHNFKENILPKKGSVPNFYLEDTHASEVGDSYFPMPKYENGEYIGLESRAHAHQTNYTSVMGYKNGATSVMTKYENLLPGPMDLLVLEYLYNKRVPYYPTDSDGEDKFVWENIPVDGKIEDYTKIDNKDYDPGYFPACNDADASLSIDPFCNRWDRGYDAPTIVTNYFDELKNITHNTITNYANLSKANPRRLENYLEYRSLWAMSRSRLFYDYLRKTYKTSIEELFSEYGTTFATNFSDICAQSYRTKNPELASKLNLDSFLITDEKINDESGDPVSSSSDKDSEDSVADVSIDRKSDTEEAVLALNKLFEDENVLNLCVATRIFLNEIDASLQLYGPDVTEVNHADRYFTANIITGDVSVDDNTFGNWQELSRLPLKRPAILSLTLPYPINPYFSRRYLAPVIDYTTDDGYFHLSTFFPVEYTKIFANTVNSNLNLEKEKIGFSIVYLGYMSRYIYYSNDVRLMTKKYIDEIVSKSKFDYSFAVVTIEEDPNNESNNDGEINNFIAKVKRYKQGSESNDSTAEIYFYLDEQLINIPSTNSMILPISPLRWFSDKSAIYFAINLDFDYTFDTQINTSNAKTLLTERYKTRLTDCTEGDRNNGLKYFFGGNSNDDDPSNTYTFESYKVENNIAKDKGAQNQFWNEIYNEYVKYYDENNPKYAGIQPDEKVCESALTSQEILIYGASAINGLYFPGINKYLNRVNGR